MVQPAVPTCGVEIAYLDVVGVRAVPCRRRLETEMSEAELEIVSDRALDEPLAVRVVGVGRRVIRRRQRGVGASHVTAARRCVRQTDADRKKSSVSFAA